MRGTGVKGDACYVRCRHLFLWESLSPFNNKWKFPGCLRLLMQMPGRGGDGMSFTEVSALLLLLIAVAGLVYQFNQRK